MTVTVKSSSDGLSAVIQINGVDIAMIDSTGKITAVSFAGNGALLTGLPSSVSSVVGQTGAVTAAQVLTALLAVDGSGSGLDADTLDGQHASAFASAGHGHSYAPMTAIVNITDRGTAYGIRCTRADGSILDVQLTGSPGA